MSVKIVVALFVRDEASHVERRVRRQADLPLDLGIDEERISDDPITRYLDVYFLRKNSGGAPELPTVKGAAAEKQRLLGINEVEEAARNVRALYGQRLDGLRQRSSSGARYRVVDRRPPRSGTFFLARIALKFDLLCRYECRYRS